MEASTPGTVPSHSTAVRTRWIVAGVLSALYAVVLVRTAWIGDDAFISLRNVDNFLQGYGLRWNTAERVQTYTHPLWLLLLCALTSFTRELYLTTIVASIVASTLGYAVLLTKLTRSVVGTLTTGLILLLAPAFISYSTSGLENPLSFLLIALFLVVVFDDRPTTRRSLTLGVLASLLMVNRYDLGLLVLPALALDIYRDRSAHRVRAMALGMIPLLAWVAFALVYYGFFLPNSAYAKLATGVARIDYLQQGMYYLFDALQRETLMMVTLATVLVMAWVSTRGQQHALGLGILFYIIYTVVVGGDFMLGRLFTVPLIVAGGLVANADVFLRGRRKLLALALVLALGFTGRASTVLSGKDYGHNIEVDAYRTHGITNERAYWFNRHGLLNGKPLLHKLGHNMAYLRKRQSTELDAVKLVNTAGAKGLNAGPEVFLIDQWALGDALLSHLPMRAMKWRAGHFQRLLPAGYIVSVGTHRNELKDPLIHEYYDHLRILVRGPLFTRKRWATIVKMNLGCWESLVRNNTSYEVMNVRDSFQLRRPRKPYSAEQDE